MSSGGELHIPVLAFVMRPASLVGQTSFPCMSASDYSQIAPSLTDDHVRHMCEELGPPRVTGGFDAPLIGRGGLTPFVVCTDSSLLANYLSGRPKVCCNTKLSSTNDTCRVRNPLCCTVGGLVLESMSTHGRHSEQWLHRICKPQRFQNATGVGVTISGPSTRSLHALVLRRGPEGS